MTRNSLTPPPSKPTASFFFTSTGMAILTDQPVRCGCCGTLRMLFFNDARTHGTTLCWACVQNQEAIYGENP